MHSHLSSPLVVFQFLFSKAWTDTNISNQPLVIYSACWCGTNFAASLLGWAANYECMKSLNLRCQSRSVFSILSGSDCPGVRQKSFTPHAPWPFYLGLSACQAEAGCLIADHVWYSRLHFEPVRDMSSSCQPLEQLASRYIIALLIRTQQFMGRRDQLGVCICSPTHFAEAPLSEERTRNQLPQEIYRCPSFAGTQWAGSLLLIHPAIPTKSPKTNSEVGDQEQYLGLTEVFGHLPKLQSLNSAVWCSG